MLKNISKLEGAKKLSKNEQKSINGGTLRCGVNEKLCDFGGGDQFCIPKKIYC
jgi:hypothetical protein